MAGMMECVQLVVAEIAALQTDNQFNDMIDDCQSRASEIGLEELQVSRFYELPVLLLVLWIRCFFPEWEWLSL